MLSERPPHGTMNVFTLLFLLSTVLPALLSLSSAFQLSQKNFHPLASFPRTNSAGTLAPDVSDGASLRSTPLKSTRPLFMAGAAGVTNDGGDDDSNKLTAKTTMVRSVRDTLRTATGFSLTALRATLRGITGISLTAVYVSTVAATGLWIRKITSLVLSLFPSGFRYFMQPLLVLYYAPLFIVRSATGPARRRAMAKHRIVVEGWKEAVEHAEQTEKDGYWPVVVSDDGYFQLVAPPTPEADSDAIMDSLANEQEMADAMAETVEHAMEVNDSAHSGRD